MWISEHNPRRPGSRGAVRALLSLAIVAAAFPPGLAGITVDIDGDTLNRVLAGLAAQRVEIPLQSGGSLRVELKDLRVTGFSPSGDAAQPGAIRTSVRLEAPEIGLSMPLEPRLALQVLERPEGSLLELRFAQVRLDLPLGRGIDVARFLPPLSFPADHLFALEGASGPLELRSRLRRVTMHERFLRFELDIEVLP